jgi:oxalate decarboxylase/phosphoglucose isomerase-like protein (cupin superfamily)
MEYRWAVGPYRIILFTMKKPFIKSLSDITVEQAHDGAGSRQLLLSKGDPISRCLEALTKGYLKAGGEFNWHSHFDIDEFFIVIKGNGALLLKDGTELKYKPGDLVYIPSNIEHKIEAQGKTDNEFYFVRLKNK